MNLGNRIKELRITNDMSQQELAEKIYVSRQAISKWERDDTLPDAENIVLISNIFNITTDYLLKGEDNSSNKNNSSNDLEDEILKKKKHDNRIDIENNQFKNRSIYIIVFGLLIGLLGNKSIPILMISLFIQIFGIIYFEINYIYIDDYKIREKKSRFNFLMIWLITPLPSFLISDTLIKLRLKSIGFPQVNIANILDEYSKFVDYGIQLKQVNSYRYIIALIIYILISSILSYIMINKDRIFNRSKE